MRHFLQSSYYFLVILLCGSVCKAQPVVLYDLNAQYYAIQEAGGPTQKWHLDLPQNRAYTVLQSGVSTLTSHLAFTYSAWRTDGPFEANTTLVVQKLPASSKGEKQTISTIENCPPPCLLVRTEPTEPIAYLTDQLTTLTVEGPLSTELPAGFPAQFVAAAGKFGDTLWGFVPRDQEFALVDLTTGKLTSQPLPKALEDKHWQMGWSARSTGTTMLIFFAPEGEGRPFPYAWVKIDHQTSEVTGAVIPEALRAKMQTPRVWVDASDRFWGRSIVTSEGKKSTEFFLVGNADVPRSVVIPGRVTDLTFPSPQKVYGLVDGEVVDLSMPFGVVSKP